METVNSSVRDNPDLDVSIYGNTRFRDLGEWCNWVAMTTASAVMCWSRDLQPAQGVWGLQHPQFPILTPTLTLFIATTVTILQKCFWSLGSLLLSPDPPTLCEIKVSGRHHVRGVWGQELAWKMVYIPQSPYFWHPLPIIKGWQLFVEFVCDFVVELFSVWESLLCLLDLLVCHLLLRSRRLCGREKIINNKQEFSCSKHAWPSAHAPSMHRHRWENKSLALETYYFTTHDQKNYIV